MYTTVDKTITRVFELLGIYKLNRFGALRNSGGGISYTQTE